MRELIVDSFAGGGGASTGIEMALGRGPDIAINHNPRAIAMHYANHPETLHYLENVWDVDPFVVCKGRPVGLMWLSPDCTFFSKARGAKPFRDRKKARRRRGLANLAIRWAKAVRPRLMVMENVEEFEKWCPLLEDGTPDWSKSGFSFRRWKKSLENCGYKVELRQLRACDYGAPTTRKRLFIIARCDGEAIVWPSPTHGPGRTPFRTAAECIDWSIRCPSIFERSKPLAENTLRRIARGIRKYVIDAKEPFIVPYHSATSAGSHRVQSVSEPLPTQDTSNRFGLVSPLLARIGQTGNAGGKANDAREPLTTTTKAEHLLVSAGLIHRGNGERERQDPRTYDIKNPHPTVVAGGIKTGLVAAFLAKHYGGHETPGAGPQMPLPTITAQDHHSVVSAHLSHFYSSNTAGGEGDPNKPLKTVTSGGQHAALVHAFLVKYFGTDQDPQLAMPLHTVTTKDRFGLVTVHGQDYVIADIGMRMLTPRELFNAQGFPPNYIIDVEYEPGRWLPKTSQVEAVGNSVPPQLSEAIIDANCSDLAVRAEVA